MYMYIQLSQVCAYHLRSLCGLATTRHPSVLPPSPLLLVWTGLHHGLWATRCHIRGYVGKGPPLALSRHSGQVGILACEGTAWGSHTYAAERSLEGGGGGGGGGGGEVGGVEGERGGRIRRSGGGGGGGGGGGSDSQYICTYMYNNALVRESFPGGYSHEFKSDGCTVC